MQSNTNTELPHFHLKTSRADCCCGMYLLKQVHVYHNARHCYVGHHSLVWTILWDTNVLHDLKMSHVS